MARIGLGLHPSGAAPWWPQGALYAADFVNGRYMRLGVPVPASAAFSLVRSSTATMPDGVGQWRSFGANVLRRIGGQGALIEPATTNYCRASEDIGGAGWTTPPAQLTRTGTASDGFTFTVNTAMSGFLTLEQSFTTIASGNDVYIAFDLHEAGLGKAAIWTPLTGYAPTFDAKTGTSTGSNAGMTSLGAGWYRCFWRLTTSGTLSALRIRLGNSAASMDYAVGQSYRIRAPQFEIGRLTSYSPNFLTATSGIRAADELSLQIPSVAGSLRVRLSTGSVLTVPASGGTTMIDPMIASPNRLLMAWHAP